jgi:hypothetical protein
MAAKGFWHGVRAVGAVLMRSARGLAQDKNESWPITEAPYRTSDATDPRNALGPPPDGRSGPGTDR